MKSLVIIIGEYHNLIIDSGIFLYITKFKYRMTGPKAIAVGI